MTFQPAPGLLLKIQNKVYEITEHPTAKGVPYGQEGRRAVVYQLVSEDNENFALKVFKDRFRVPGMVGVAERLEPYANISGLQVCERIVLTASRHRDLLTQYPEMTYAVLMPWVEGPTWQEILLTEDTFSPARSLTLAKRFAEIMVGMEEISLAHCDISGANLLIQARDQPALVDLEEMYNPDFIKPESLPAGSPGYAHKTAPKGLWNARTDRFAGAVLLVEMLSWHDPTAREASWGESYFSPRDMQNENQRLDLLRKSLERHYGKRIPDLFNQVWLSDSLRDCPTFAEWAVALPEEANIVQPKIPSVRITPIEKDDPQSLMERGQKLTDEGEFTRALDLYRQAINVAPQKISSELEKKIVALEKRIHAEEFTPASSSKDNSYPARPCPDCGKEILKEQRVCPHCEGVPTQEVQVPKKSHKTMWRIWIGITAVLALSAVGFFMRDNLVALSPKGNTETSEPLATTITLTPVPTSTETPPSPTVELPTVLVTPSTTTITEKTVEITFASRGQVEDGLDLRTNANNAGDTSHDVGLQGFVTFDVSGIPNGATIKSARLVAINHDVLGDPFGSLGCVRAYVHNYGNVSYSDFSPAGAVGAVARFCSEAELGTKSIQIMNSAGIQAALASDDFQIRLQFKDMHSDGDGVADVLRGSFKIIVTYQEP